MNATHPAQNITTDTFHGTLRREQGAVQLLATVTVPGEPVPKSRARYNGQGPKIRAYTPTSTLEAEQVIKWHYRKAVGPSQPEGRSGFGLACVFYVGKRQRRDVDNMIKLVADALTGLAWVDDSQMTEVSGRMVHGSSEPRLVFEVYYTDDLPDHARKQCGHCGKYFRTYASWEKKKTCSRACGTAALFDSRQRTCIGCGGQFTIKGSSEADRKYCSKACVHTHKTLHLTCPRCGTEFDRPRSLVRQPDRSYCTKQCADARAADFRKISAAGTCDACGGKTTKKTYRRCRACVTAKREAS